MPPAPALGVRGTLAERLLGPARKTPAAGSAETDRRDGAGKPGVTGRGRFLPKTGSSGPLATGKALRHIALGLAVHRPGRDDPLAARRRGDHPRGGVSLSRNVSGVPPGAPFTDGRDVEPSVEPCDRLIERDLFGSAIASPSGTCSGRTATLPQ